MNSKTLKAGPIDARFADSLACLLLEGHMGPNSLSRYPEYGNESNRVQSFLFWPPHYRQQPAELAEAGFFSRGTGDRVTCFYCGKTLTDWEPEDGPWEEHARHSPGCQWLLTQKGKIFVDEITKKYPKFEDFVDLRNISLDGRESLESEDHIKYIFAKNPNYCSERSRRGTFSNWSSGHSHNPTTLVQAGFFSLGVGDHVKCFYCGVHLSNWEPQDEPWEEHARHSPDCKWLLEQKGRRFIDDVRKKYQSLQASNNENTASKDEDENIASEDDILFLFTKYPNYCSNDRRLGTFSNWPVGHCQRPYSVAEAGFFSRGVGDQVTCFNCGATLVNWDPEDEPWEEHARYSPRCEWLLKRKGQHFVDEVGKKYALESTVHSVSPTGYPLNIEASIEAVYPPSIGQKRLPATIAKDYIRDKNQHSTSTDTLEITQKMEKIQIEEESTSSEEVEKLREKILCKICLDNDLTVVFHPCKHMISCKDCADRIEKCPICRTCIDEKVQVFLS